MGVGHNRWRTQVVYYDFVQQNGGFILLSGARKLLHTTFLIVLGKEHDTYEHSLCMVSYPRIR